MKFLVFAGFLGLISLNYYCKTNTSATKSLGDAVGSPQEIFPGLYSVRCSDGTVSYVNEADLNENDGERVCRAERSIYTLQKTIIAAKSLNQKGNCHIPANTLVRLAAPLKTPTGSNDQECNNGWWDAALLQKCRNFEVEFLNDPANRGLIKKGIGSDSSEPCHLSEGKIFGPFATTNDIETLSANREKKSPVRFIYTDRQLGYPRLASYPSYPYQPGD